MKCAMCEGRSKDWAGDDARCAFNGDFADNWKCATLQALRSLIKEDEPEAFGISFMRSDDQKYATIFIGDVENSEGDTFGQALWLTWCKDRGRTEQVYVLGDEGGPRLPTEDEIVSVVDHYRLKEVAR